MSYKLYDINGDEITQYDLQDKGVWCKKGATKEEVFVEKFGAQLGLQINPAKVKDPYAPDLLNTANGHLADLKTQNTPFFQAHTRFKYNPQYTVVFNGKDRDRYKANYPNIEIYFAVDWQVLKFQGRDTIEVHPMMGTWYISFKELDNKLEHAPFHAYQQRRSDQKGNARGSYVLNLLDPGFDRLI